jgi:23S rRNA (guanosine2251-2'-O)-methyltransferase
LGHDRQFADIVRLARAARVPVSISPRRALDRLVPDGKHQGVVGLIAPRRYAAPEEMLAAAGVRGEPPFVVILDGVEDPRNLGAVLRTAEAAGVHGVLIPERRSVGLTATVGKVAAGAMERLRVGRVQNVSRAIEALKSEGLWVYALDPAAPRSYTSLDLRGPVALVLGGEGKGVRPGVREKCDECASIPMLGRIGSLNVSVAAGIVMYEVVRQRMSGTKIKEK